MLWINEMGALNFWNINKKIDKISTCMHEKDSGMLAK